MEQDTASKVSNETNVDSMMLESTLDVSMMLDSLQDVPLLPSTQADSMLDSTQVDKPTMTLAMRPKPRKVIKPKRPVKARSYDAATGMWTISYKYPETAVDAETCEVTKACMRQGNHPKGDEYIKKSWYMSRKVKTGLFLPKSQQQSTIYEMRREPTKPRKSV